MWRTLKRDVHELVRDRPGHRFASFHRRRRRHDEHRLASALYILLGIVVLLVGIVLSISPIVPGFFLVIAGLVIVIARVGPVAHWLDRGELRVRAIARRLGWPRA